MIKRVSILAALSSMFFIPTAHADDYGCQVLLCLSNPNGPMAVAECVPPIQRLYRDIFRWRPRPFPTCALSNGMDSSSGGNYARVGGASFYDACPAGTTDAPLGALVAGGAIGGPASTSGLIPVASGGVQLQTTLYAGIGSGAGQQPDAEGTPMPTKICVGNRIATTSVTVGQFWDDQQTYSVGVYDRVATVSPSGDTFNVQVFINGSLNKIVRPFSPSVVQVVYGQ